MSFPLNNRGSSGNVETTTGVIPLLFSLFTFSSAILTFSSGVSSFVSAVSSVSSADSRMVGPGKDQPQYFVAQFEGT